MRLHRACILLEIIDDKTGQLSAIGYELDVGQPMASVDYRYEMSVDYRGGWIDFGSMQMKPSEYHIVIDGAGREFHMDLGTWFEPPSQRELNPAQQELEEETS